MAGSSTPMFGYFSKVALISPTANGRGSMYSRGAELLGGHRAGAVLHLAVGERGTVLDHEDALAAASALGSSTVTGEAPMMTVDRRVDAARGGQLGLDAGAVGGVDLVDDDHVGHAQVDLAGVVASSLPGPVRVGDGDRQVGLVERKSLLPPSQRMTSASFSASRRMAS